MTTLQLPPHFTVEIEPSSGHLTVRVRSFHPGSQRRYLIQQHSEEKYLFCSCPAWQERKDVPVESRTCKHIQAFGKAMQAHLKG